MTNKEWLEKCKDKDNSVLESIIIKHNWRQVKALEIIAEELIRLNEGLEGK